MAIVGIRLREVLGRNPSRIWIGRNILKMRQTARRCEVLLTWTAASANLRANLNLKDP